MQEFEYKVVPAPKRGLRGKGVKGGEAKFAHAMATLMNELGDDGWDYVRADTLPCEERTGLTSRTTQYYNVLVFRRARFEAEAAAPQPHAITQSAVPPMTLPEVAAPDPWEKFAMAVPDMTEDEDADPAVIDLLAERKARSPDASPAAVRHHGAAE